MTEFFELYILSFENREAHIAAYSAKKPESFDFSECFDVNENDIGFIAERIKSHSRGLFLLDLGGRAAFILTSLYYSTRLLLCAVTNVSTELAAAFSDIVGNIEKAPSAKEKRPLKRLSAKSTRELFDLTDTLDSLVPKNTLLPVVKSYSLFFTLEETARRASRLVGCGLETENDGSVADVENYDIPLFTAFILCCAAYTRRAGATRCGKLNLSVRDSKLYAEFSADVIADMSPFEFKTLRSLVDEAEIYFYASKEKGIFTAELAAQRPDMSKLRLKNGIELN